MDFSKLCQEYCKVYNISGEPNLDLLNLSIDGNVMWSNVTPQPTSQEATSRQLYVKYDPNQKELYSDVETTKESVCKTKVTLLQGLAPGLNKPLKVPTSGLPSVLGKYVEVQPGKSTHEREDRRTVKLGSAHKMDSSKTPALATISSKDTYFVGRFSFTVKLGGKVIFPQDNVTTEEFGVAKLVNDVKLWPKEIRELVEKDLRGLEIMKGDDGALEYIKWTIAGTCEFQGDFEQTIEWK